MENLNNFWTLSKDEQEAIREANPGYADTEEDHQAFLNALFPEHTLEEAEELYHLSEGHVEGQAKQEVDYRASREPIPARSIMKITIFSSWMENTVEAKFSQWIAEQGSMINVESVHFSTAHDTNNGYTIFSVMIVYREL